jgi:Protein of unknown function (DUF4031)
MSVYVDAPVHRYGRMLMCHMVADSHVELMSIAERIGIARRWLQHEGTDREHFDVCKSMRALAIREGAIETTSRHIVGVIRNKRPVTK